MPFASAPILSREVSTRHAQECEEEKRAGQGLGAGVRRARGARVRTFSAEGGPMSQVAAGGETGRRALPDFGQAAASRGEATGWSAGSPGLAPLPGPPAPQGSRSAPVLRIYEVCEERID